MNHGSTTGQGERAVTQLYEALARYNWWLRRLRGPAPGERLEMHKRLAAGRGDVPEQGVTGLDRWLLDRLRPGPGAKVLDVGAGFGATLFAWTKQDPAARGVGLGLSPFQVRMAQREARRLGVEGVVDFRVGSFDRQVTPLATHPGERPARAGTPVTRGFDYVLSIESLFHSPDLERTLTNLASAMAPGARLALVEDMAENEHVARGTHGRALLGRWAAHTLHSREAYVAALEAAGLGLERETNLTPQVTSRSTAELSRSQVRLSRLHALAPLPMARRILEAYLGGIALERLYSEEEMSYRVLIAVRGEAT